MLSQDIVLPVIALILGIKHGVDWDHIVAILDIIASQESRKRGIYLSFLYALGHAIIVASLATLAIVFGFFMPKVVAHFMEQIVGLSLVVLGIYVFFALRRYGNNFRLLPRWAILANMVLFAYTWLKSKILGVDMRTRPALKINYGNLSAFSVGIIHGIGSETPTQIFFFVLTLQASIIGIGHAIIVAFVLGLIIMNTLIAVLGSVGLISLNTRSYKLVAYPVGLLSIAIGIIFLTNNSHLLPSLVVSGFE